MSNLKKKVTLIPKPEDECLLHHGFKSHQEWDRAINESQTIWPKYVEKIYNCKFFTCGRDDDRYRILSKFLEVGAYTGTLVYHHYHQGFSWVVVDNYEYSLLLTDLEVDTNYVLVEQRDGDFNLVRRER